LPFATVLAEPALTGRRAVVRLQESNNAGMNAVV
jgi:hypothetical protein